MYIDSSVLLSHNKTRKLPCTGRLISAMGGGSGGQRTRGTITSGGSKRVHGEGNSWVRSLPLTLTFHLQCSLSTAGDIPKFLSEHQFKILSQRLTLYEYLDLPLFTETNKTRHQHREWHTPVALHIWEREIRAITVVWQGNVTVYIMMKMNLKWMWWTVPVKFFKPT